MDDEFGDLSDLDVDELELLSTQAVTSTAKGIYQAPKSTFVAETHTSGRTSLHHHPDEFDLSDINSDELTAVHEVRRQPQTLVQTTLYRTTVPGSAEVRRIDPVSEPPTHHVLNTTELGTWVYPTNLGSIRDYQYNIVARGLFHNLLVALPTGMGKTFIAATIMLNWFRWTKSSQIIFVAPTKPLVTQQIGACFGIVGIPQSQTTVMTGGISPGVRAEEWKSKRVFFMTPQTLINDLKNGICDPKRIVLLVVDEAHRATGAYAYVEVVKFIARFNESFRVLALTATPGSGIESVQEVIDGLRIARVEIRTENSLDIRQYVHRRNVEKVVFQPSAEMEMLQELYSNALQPLSDVLFKNKAVYKNDPISFTAYGLTQSRQKWMASVGQHANMGLKNMITTILTTLSSLAHGMELLKYYGTIPFFVKMNDFRKETLEKGSKAGKYRKQINENKDFDLMMSRMTAWSNDPDFMGHPKLEYLKSCLSNHFLDAGEGLESNQDGKSSTKVIVFAHFRDSAEDIARVLKPLSPIVRANVFVGQQSSKNSDGMDQKTQQIVMEKFRSGEINTLIATSIGEEGLDIGEVDLIVCYDSKASPLRMLQRMGRTGRKRSGRIILLQMSGKEEEDAEKAKSGYEHMQEQIALGTKFAFHEDSDRRILPRHVVPEVDKRVVIIPIENTQADGAAIDSALRKRKAKRAPKKFNMPDGVETGFVSAADISGNGASLPKGKKTKMNVDPNQKSIEAFIKPPRSRPHPATIPTLEEVILSPAQTVDLEVRYQQDSGNDQQNHCDGNEITVGIPRLDLHPGYQRGEAPSFMFPDHGRERTRGGLARLVERMYETADKFQDVFDRDSVDRWTGEEDGLVDGGRPARSAHVVPSPRQKRMTALPPVVPTVVRGRVPTTDGPVSRTGPTAARMQSVASNIATTARTTAASSGLNKPTAGRLKRTHLTVSKPSGVESFFDMEASDDDDEEEEDEDEDDTNNRFTSNRTTRSANKRTHSTMTIEDLEDDDDLPDLGIDLTRPSSDFGFDPADQSDLEDFVVGDSDEEAIMKVSDRKRRLKNRNEQKSSDITFGTDEHDHTHNDHGSSRLDSERGDDHPARGPFPFPSSPPPHPLERMDRGNGDDDDSTLAAQLLLSSSFGATTGRRVVTTRLPMFSSSFEERGDDDTIDTTTTTNTNINRNINSNGNGVARNLSKRMGRPVILDDSSPVAITKAPARTRTRILTRRPIVSSQEELPDIDELLT